MRERIDDTQAVVVLLVAWIFGIHRIAATPARRGENGAVPPGQPEPLTQSTRQRSRQQVRPLGLLYGNRVFLVGWTDWAEEPRLGRLANISEARLTGVAFERHYPAFDLQRYAERSFGVFQEKPVKVVLRFDAEAAREIASTLYQPRHRARMSPPW